MLNQTILELRTSVHQKTLLRVKGAITELRHNMCIRTNAVMLYNDILSNDRPYIPQ
jgi:hypothetical protein